MSDLIEAAAQPCPKPRCTGRVTAALQIRQGGHKQVALDPEPVVWGPGQRFRLSANQPGTDPLRRPLVALIASGTQAFGVRTMYRLHAEVCGGGTGVHARSKEAA